MDCPDCNAKGEISRSCSHCRGTGWGECPECGGSVYSGGDVLDSMTCDSCRGAGRLVCDVCGGIGHFTEVCQTCGGGGHLSEELLRQIMDDRSEAERSEREHLAQHHHQEERKEKLLRQRKLWGDCLLCGKPLGFIDKLCHRVQHSQCKVFHE